MTNRTIPVAVRITDEMRRKMRNKAVDLGLDESNLIRLAISLFLSNDLTNSKENSSISKQKKD